MRLHRFAMLHLKPEPRDWGFWESSHASADHEIKITRLPVHPQTKQKKGIALSSGWLVSAILDLIGTPDLDEQNRMLIPLEVREPCENAIDTAADLISVLEGCSRSVLSPLPCLALEYQNDEERAFLEASAGMKAGDISSEASPRLPIDRKDQKLLKALGDRTIGVTLLAEAYSGGGESGRYRDFVRFFELAFRLSSSQLGKKLSQFLPPAMGYSRQEVEDWFKLRDPVSHADFRKSQFIAVASDIRMFLLRMEQAALDVLFNKAEWMRPSKTRRSVWFPDAISTTRAGNIVIKQGTKARLLMRAFDEFGVYPRDLGAVLGSFKQKNLYAKFAPTDSDRQLAKR